MLPGAPLCDHDRIIERENLLMSAQNLPIEMPRIDSIIKKRLVHAPREAKERFPAVLRQTHFSWASLTEPEYLMVAFITDDEQKRLKEFVAKRLNPFPGLITVANAGAAFRVEKSKYMTLNGCRVSNSFTFSLGPDSTIVLIDHHQSINTKELGIVTYTIPLAYIVSYGDEIDNSSVYEYFDGLVAHSINSWREADA